MIPSYVIYEVHTPLSIDPKSDKTTIEPRLVRSSKVNSLRYNIDVIEYTLINTIITPLLIDIAIPNETSILSLRIINDFYNNLESSIRLFILRIDILRRFTILVIGSIKDTYY